MILLRSYYYYIMTSKRMQNLVHIIAVHSFAMRFSTEGTRKQVCVCVCVTHLLKCNDIMVSWFHPPFVHLFFSSQKNPPCPFPCPSVGPWVPSKEYKESKELGISNQEVSPSPPPAASSVPLGWFEPQPMLGEENLRVILFRKTPTVS